MNNNKGILVIVELKDGIIPPIASELFGAAKIVSGGLPRDISIVVIGPGAGSIAGSLGKFGASSVYASDSRHLTSSEAATFIESAIGQSHPSVVLLGETDLGRDLAPILAATLNTAAVTDVVALRVDNGVLIATRPVYGGNALADFSIETAPQIIAVRPKAFVPAAFVEGSLAVVIVLPAVDPSSGVRVLERVTVARQGPRIEEAKIVVGGGRGLGGPEGFIQLKQVAELLGGVVGASRPPCDQGWWPESGQIGITGKIISPDLYVAVGISGSSQHVSGVSGAKTIVAINKDIEANIFKVASYGVTGDWKKVIPAFAAKVRELTGR